MSLLLFFNDQRNYCDLAAGEVQLQGHAPTFVLNVLVPVPEPEVREPGGFAEYDAILWPQQWSTPRISVSLIPHGRLEIRANRPAVAVTTRQFSRMESRALVVQAEPVLFYLTERHRSLLVPAKISTKALPPGILVQETPISEGELICLLML